MKQELLEKAIALRHELHRYPELSEKEVRTKKILMEFIKVNTDLQVVDRGQWFYAVYEPKQKSEKGRIAFRADMDAISVFEDSNLPYASENPGVAHKCGHDGHSAALAAFAMELSETGTDREVYLIFQHAEENGAGGKVCAQLIEEKQIEAVYALHNFPGFEEGALLLREGTINCASMGMELTFTGVSAHASQPEKGRNPAAVISRLVLALEKMAAPECHEGLILATVVQVDIGERAFGVAAHKGKLLLTIRGQIEDEMNALRDRIENFAKEQAQQYGLLLQTAYHDVFPETYNHGESIEKIRKITDEKGWKTQTLENPIRSSEDFGWYLKKASGALVWMGAGMECTPIHSAEFDYNDNLIERSVLFFQSLL
ncbi:amidohydrolase [Anaerotruncus sp. 80]|uniref:Amidohydrolase n=1 Tax=Anaerotruncus colihominis TaxID=169435 RepID=A0A845QPP1_9FIRM|nr:MULTISPECIES: M20 family metallopeptidase [Anaerotruncus]NBH62677.1 amidohydrolase [Anaerotruncus colihominis]NCF03332.1 amidohydrolase [Anaerotruncus sp. 80]